MKLKLKKVQNLTNSSQSVSKNVQTYGNLIFITICIPLPDYLSLLQYFMNPDSISGVHEISSLT